jgi:hypothetical protein
MKAILTSLFTLLSVITAVAQFDTNRPQTVPFDQYWTYGFNYGIAQLNGDISSQGYFAKLSKESKPSFSLFMGKQISSVLGVKFELGRSHLYSTSDTLISPYQDRHSLFSATGDVTEIGLYGTLNINNLLNKNRSTDSKWNLYFSTGLGYAFSKTRLRDLIFTDSTYLVSKSMLIVPITIGVNFKLADGLWLSVENSFRFANTHLLDAYYSTQFDKYTTTKVGLTFNFQKLRSGKSTRKERVVKTRVTPAYIEPSNESGTPEVTTRRSLSRSSQRTPPELLDYTGFNPLIPPPVVHNSTVTNPNTSATGNKDENRWADPNNPGQFEITGVYNKKTVVDTLEVKKIKPMKFKGRTIRITRGFGPSGSSVSRSGSPVTSSGTRVISSRRGNTKTQNNTTSESFTPGTIYKIQIQASKENLPVETVAKKMNITETVTVEMSDGWYRYYIGAYTAYSAARQNLTSYRSKGIKDAFICAFPNGVRRVIKN